MANNQYLRKQGNVWYVELCVPLKVRKKAQEHLFSAGLDELSVKSKFSKSLGTTNVVSARVSRHAWLAHWQEIVSNAHCGKFDDDIFRHKKEKKTDVTLLVSELEAKDYSALDSYCDVWLKEHMYAKSTEYAARTFIKGVLTSRFKTFDQVSENSVKDWFAELQYANTENTRRIGISGLRRRLNFMSLYFRFCWERGYISHEIKLSRSILPKTPKTRAGSETKNRSFRPYSIGDCKELLFTACRNGHPDLALAILLSMHTGMRLGEICSLKLSNCNAYALSVQDSKTYSGRRVIPIHKQILDIYQQVLSARVDDFFIPRLSQNNQTGDRSVGLKRKFARMKSKLNFGRFYGFHSFRSTVATQLESAGVPEIYAARLLGHKVSTISYGLYSGQTSQEKVSIAVNTLNYQFTAAEMKFLTSHFFADYFAT